MASLIPFVLYLFLCVSKACCYRSVGFDSRTDTLVVNTTLGAIRGVATSSSAGTTFYAFSGIPYAKPPVGELRFKRPLPAEPWNGTRDGSAEGSMCTQTGMGEEDCLYLNVFTPEVPQTNASKAVMFWIHGGALKVGTGSAMFSGPGRLMDYDVVIVTINYRLGVFGFLSTMDAECPGNFGLWDQLLALQWVHDNIRAFGGDPEKVTVFGESAGSVSGGYLVLSPQAEGLFQSVIGQSGTPMSMISTDHLALEEAHELANHSNCPTESAQLLQCLRAMTTQEIMDAYSQFAYFPTNLPLKFWMVVDNFVEDSFIPDEPRKLLERGAFNKVPSIQGLNALEGGFFVMEYLAAYPELFNADFINNNFQDIILNITSFTRNLDQIGDLIKQEYFADVNLENLTQLHQALYEIYSDAVMNAGTDAFLKLRTNDSSTPPTYMYLFTYQGEYTFSEFVLTNATINRAPATTHCDDLLYLFEIPIFNWGKMSPRDNLVSQTMLQLWTNFAKYGKPTVDGEVHVQWEPFNGRDVRYLKIDEDLDMEDAFRQPQANLWNVVLPQIDAGTS